MSLLFICLSFLYIYDLTGCYLCVQARWCLGGVIDKKEWKKGLIFVYVRLKSGYVWCDGNDLCWWIMPKAGKAVTCHIICKQVDGNIKQTVLAS